MPLRRTTSRIAWGLAGLALLVSPPRATAAEPEGDEPLTLTVGESLVITPSAQYRPRFLVHGGRDLKPGNAYDAFSQRARLGAEAKVLTWFTLKVELQDVRRWGEETDTLADSAADGFDLHQAWGEANCPLGLSLRAGRQELSYDNQRLIGAASWTEPGRSFDALRLSYRLADRGLQVDAFYAKTGEEDAYVSRTNASGKPETVRGSTQDTDLLGAWARYSAWNPLRGSLILLYDWNGPKDQNRFTVGAYLDGGPLHGLRYSGEFYYQVGRQRTEDLAKDISAFLGAVTASYTAPVLLSPSVGAWLDYLSGDDDTGDSTLETFDTLFATNHPFYGLMDFFLAIPTDTGQGGLIDAGGRVKLQPAEWLEAAVDYHHFELAQARGSGGTLGNELDVVITSNINRYLSLQGMFGVLFPKRSLSALRGGGEETEYLGYIQTDLHF